MSRIGVRYESPYQEPAPSERGQGAGAGAQAPAGGAPTARVKCWEFAYRNNIKTAGRTQYYLVDVTTWEILKPTRIERSRTGAHGKDIYCLPHEAWGKTITVLLERSNSGKLRYEVIAPPGLEKYKEELEELLAKCGSFWEMEETIEMWVEAHHLGRGVSA